MQCNIHVHTKNRKHLISAYCFFDSYLLM